MGLLRRRRYRRDEEDEVVVEKLRDEPCPGKHTQFSYLVTRSHGTLLEIREKWCAACGRTW